MDDKLIALAISGDRAAFEAIYRNLVGFVYTVAFRVVRNEQDAQEVTQDVFIKLHKNLKDFRGESSLRTWVYRITVNAALSTYRARNRHMRGRVEIEEDSPLFVDTHATEEIHAAAEPLAQIDKYMECLTSEQRASLILREVQGLSYEEIAAATQVPVNTVRSRLSRARETLIAFRKKEQADEL